MRIQAAMLCESASVLSGKLYVLGAGLSTVVPASMPTDLTAVIAGIVEADPDIDVGEIPFVIRVTDQGGSDLLRGEMRVQVEAPALPGTPVVMPMVAPLQFSVGSPGLLEVTIGNEAGIEARMPLMVTSPVV